MRVENRQDAIEQTHQFDRRDRIRAAAAKRDALHPPAPAEPLRNERDLRPQSRQIVGEPLLAPGGAGVAAAIPADLLAKGDMDIERNRRRRLDPVERARIGIRADIVGKLHRGGIAGVARHRLGEQIGMIGPHEKRPTSAIRRQH